MAPFVLKFKGNKSFSPFSNIADSDSLTRTWKVCTKIASHLEQGQRLENLSWRLWHLQNLIVETDNAKSKREFKKLSKWMGDRLDKDKGRSIEELEAPDFRRTDSSDKIRQRAEEKERNRDNHLPVGGNSMKGMQYTFALDTNVRGRPAAAKKIDLTKPHLKRPGTAAGNVTPRPMNRGPNGPKGGSPDTTMRELSPAGGSSNTHPRSDGVSLRFPTLFSNDFGPTALLCPPPTISATLSYGDASYSNNDNDSFGISRPTFEFGLDEILGSEHSLSPNEMQQDLPATPATTTMTLHTPAPSHPPTRASLISPVNAIPSTSATSSHSAPVATPSSLPPLVIPKTANPAALGFSPFAESYGEVSATSPSKAVRQGPSATPPARGSANSASTGAPVNHGNTAPGGVKSECSNCGATHTPLWRRGLNDELNCNACGLYCKLHKRPRPRTLRNTHGDAARGAGWGGRNGESEIVGDPVQCYNCSTTATPLWRKDDEGNTLCNACGLYLKLHGSKRPLSMKSDVIRKRSRHDTEKRPSSAATPNNSPPSASPGASRRTSTTPPPQSSEPFTGPSPNEMQYQFPEYDFASESELMGALGGSGGPGELNYSAFAPFAPEFISTYSEQSSGNSAEKTPSTDTGNDRGHKRRRLSEASDYSTSNGLQSPRQGPQDHSSNASSRSNHSPASSLALSLHQSPTSPNYSITALPFPSYEMYHQQNQSSNSGTPMSSPFHPPMTGLWDNYHPPMNLLRDNFHPPMQLIPEDSPQLPPAYMSSGVHPPMMLPAPYFFESGEEDNENATSDQHMLSLVNDEHDHEMSSFLMDPNGDGGVKSEYDGVSVRAGDKRGFSQGN